MTAFEFELPAYHAPDFSAPQFVAAPNAQLTTVEMDGVAPENFHSTSMYPEYFKIDGSWHLAPESRMDASVVVNRLPDGGIRLDVVANRALKKGQTVVLGARPPLPATTTSSSRCCATNVSMASCFGSWARPSRLTTMRAVSCRP